MNAIGGILGRKVGMTQVFDEKGTRIGVTVIEAGPCKVLQVRTVEADGYSSIQLGFDDKKEKNTSKPLVGHFAKADSPCKRFVREIRLDAPAEVKVGEDVTVKILEGTLKVDVQGISKGKGFAGVMKRWNFKGLRQSHGTSKRHRSPGALGRHMSISKGVPKGKKMAGHLGSETVTVQGLRLVRVDPENHMLLVKGSIPGANGAFVIVRRSIQETERAHKEAKKKAG